MAPRNKFRLNFNVKVILHTAPLILCYALLPDLGAVGLTKTSMPDGIRHGPVAGHCAAVMKQMRSLQSLCDVTVVAGGKEFDAHKLVLAAGSDFFKDRFSTQRPHDVAAHKQRVTLTFDFLLPETFSLVLESMYTGKINVTDRMLSSALRLASQLGIAPLRRRLITHICQTARLEAVEELKTLGQELQSQELLDAASAVVLRNREAPVPATAIATVVPLDAKTAIKLVPLAKADTHPILSHAHTMSTIAKPSDELVLKPAATPVRANMIMPSGEVSKCPWTREEDTMVMELVSRHGLKSWSALAVHLPGRTGKQIREVSCVRVCVCVCVCV
jgi:hypothetical protein